MNRGAGRKEIFHNDDQRKFFLELLSIISADFDIEVHAFCLMSNHYHLLLRTPAPTLSVAMKFLGATYTRKFNRLTRKDGPLFRSRYKAIVINADSYLAHVSRYIHRNPLEAKMVSSVSDYPWSSYNAYLNQGTGFPWLKTEAVLSKVATNQQIEAYKQFVESKSLASLQEFYGSSRLPAVLGSKDFAHYVSGLGFPDAMRNHKNLQEPTLTEITEVTARHFSVPLESIKKKAQGVENTARAAALWLAKTRTSIGSDELASYFGVSVPGIRVAFSRSVRRVDSDPLLAHSCNAIWTDVTCYV